MRIGVGDNDPVDSVDFVIDEAAPAGDVLGALARLLISLAQNDRPDTDNRDVPDPETKDI